MKRLKGWRMSVAGWPLLIAAIVVVLQVETASPSTPGPTARTHVPAPLGGVMAAQGAMGYRAPLVVWRRVPAQIHGGVYVPGHETYVVLRPGGRQPEDVKEETAAVEEPAQAPRLCWLQRLFRKPGRCDGGP